MTDPKAPPDWYKTTEDVVARARALFGLADHAMLQGITPALRPRDADLDTEDYLRRAEVLISLTRAGAALVQAMLAAEDEQLAEELDRRLGPYPTPLGHPPALPNATDALLPVGYLDRLEAWRDDIAYAARIATDGFKAPEVTGPAADEVRRLLDEVPRREDEDDGG